MLGDSGAPPTDARSEAEKAWEAFVETLDPKHWRGSLPNDKGFFYAGYAAAQREAKEREKKLREVLKRAGRDVVHARYCSRLFGGRWKHSRRCKEISELLEEKP